MRPLKVAVVCGCGADLARAAVDVVAGDADVVGGGVPGDRDARRRRRGDPRLPGCDGGVVSPGGGGVVLVTVAVMVLVASRVPLSLRARTWKVCWPLLTVMDADGEGVAEGRR